MLVPKNIDTIETHTSIFQPNHAGPSFARPIDRVRLKAIWRGVATLDIALKARCAIH